MQELRDVDRYLEEAKTALLTFKRNELSIENSIQITIQVLMLFLSPAYSTFVTHSGLQAVFENDPGAIQREVQSRIENISGKESLNEQSSSLTEWFLVLSILWSMKTMGTTYIKMKAEGKVGMLGAPAKVLLAVRALLVYSVRLSCVVAFFGPFLGLFNVLAHWRAEQMVLDFKVYNRSHIYNSSLKRNGLSIEEVYRANYADPENPLPPSYKLYTQIGLGASFALFLVVIALQGLVNLFLERKLSPDFRAAKWTSKLQHLVESVNKADSFSDWDTVQGTPSELRKRWWKVMNETIVMIGVQLATNMALLVPLWVTSKKHFLRIISWVCVCACIPFLYPWGIPAESRVATILLIATREMNMMCIILPEILGSFRQYALHFQHIASKTKADMIILINVSSMERLPAAPAHRASLGGVRGRDQGFGAVDLAELGDALDGLLHQLP